MLSKRVSRRSFMQQLALVGGGIALAPISIRAAGPEWRLNGHYLEGCNCEEASPTILVNNEKRSKRRLRL